jgi:secreted Zn-dependent insulinase-like peptidase
MAINTKLVIKSGVGRALLDTSKLGCRFALEPSDRGWMVRIEGVNAELAATIESLVQEIHFFYYEDDAEREHHKKWWLSDLSCPILSYDAQDERLSIEVSERVGFTVDSSEHVVK